MKSQILFLPLTLILSVTLFILFIKPEWDMYQSNQGQIKQKQEKLDNFQTTYKRIKDAANKFKKTDATKINKIKNAVPTNSQKEALISDLFHLSDKENVLLKGVSFSGKESLALTGEEKEAKNNKEEAEASPEIKVTEVGLTLSGEYFDLRRFIYSLEQMIRVNTIESASFSLNDEEKTVDLGVQFNVYHREDLEKELIFQAFPDKQGWQDIIDKGFSVDFIESFNKNKGQFQVFNPDLSNVGKDNLFGNGGSYTSENNNVEDNNTQNNQEEAEEFNQEDASSDNPEKVNEEGEDLSQQESEVEN